MGLIKMGSISDAAGPDCDDGGFTAVIVDGSVALFSHEIGE